VVYGLTVGQLWLAWRSGDVLSAVSEWEGQEWIGVGAMIFGGTLRLWCYRTLGRFFTFNVSLSVIRAIMNTADVLAGYQKGQRSLEIYGLKGRVADL
jgi:hypothetical protein